MDISALKDKVGYNYPAMSPPSLEYCIALSKQWNAFYKNPSADTGQWLPGLCANLVVLIKSLNEILNLTEWTM